MRSCLHLTWSIYSTVTLNSHLASRLPISVPSQARQADTTTTTNTRSSDYFSASCQHMSGPSTDILALDSGVSDNESPHDVSFRSSDWVGERTPEGKAGHDVGRRVLFPINGHASTTATDIVFRFFDVHLKGGDAGPVVLLRTRLCGRWAAIFCFSEAQPRGKSHIKARKASPCTRHLLHFPQRGLCRRDGSAAHSAQGILRLYYVSLGSQRCDPAKAVSTSFLICGSITGTGAPLIPVASKFNCLIRVPDKHGTKEARKDTVTS